MNNKASCAFCYPREQGTHGEIKREWSTEWLQFIPVCRKHSLADGMIDGIPLTEPDSKPGADEVWGDS